MMYRTCSKRDTRTLMGSYLDVGAGDLVNAIVFRQRTGLENAIGIDISADLTKSYGIALVQADAAALPFRDHCFELVTMISLLEHVREPRVCLSEALRVLATEGELFIQFPNRYFPVEAHSGLFMHFCLPQPARERLASTFAPKIDMKNVNTPPLRNVRKMLRELSPSCEIATMGFSYPDSFLPASRLIKVASWILRHLGMFRILPMGYVILIHPRWDPLQKQTGHTPGNANALGYCLKAMQLSETTNSVQGSQSDVPSSHKGIREAFGGPCHSEHDLQSPRAADCPVPGGRGRACGARLCRISGHSQISGRCKSEALMTRKAYYGLCTLKHSMPILDFLFPNFNKILRPIACEFNSAAALSFGPPPLATAASMPIHS